MELFWCSRCWIAYPRQDHGCIFCKIPLVLVPEAVARRLGEWGVVCSQGACVTPTQRQQILGREDPTTGFLFHHNHFISRNHVILTARPFSIGVTDLQTANGTFVEDKTSQPSGFAWRQLNESEEVPLGSGDWLSLSKECLVQVWLKWIPPEMSPRDLDNVRQGSKLIHLPWGNSRPINDVVAIVWETDRHFLEVTQSSQSSSEYTVALNRRMVTKAHLYRGDRLIVEGEEYEYLPPKLVPAQPLSTPYITLAGVEVPGRLKLEELKLGGGKFIGIVGASGSGKSTLIKIVTGWLAPPVGTMKIRIENKPATLEQLKAVTAYIPQYDIVYENLTVAKSLLYSGLLQGQKKQDDLQEQIAQLLIKLGLQAVKAKRIRELSGGQRRRVNFANQLLSDQAALLVLDEPTSGLDLANDYQIMQMLQTLCRQGRSVVCTTHHLGNIDLLDEVVVLNQGVIEQQGTPAEIASEVHSPLGGDNWRSLYLSKPMAETEKEDAPLPISRHMPNCQFLVLLYRRWEEFLHPKGLWTNLLSMLVFIPLWIGLCIYIARPMEGNGSDETRLFLCLVAAFWLTMSFASQELTSDRYRIFLHEKLGGILPSSFLWSYLVFYSQVSFIQTTLLVFPSLCIIKSPGIWLFGGLTWSMGIAGAIVGLNLSFLESRYKIPTPVTVPCLTVMQLLFSKMVIGAVLEDMKYFAWKMVDMPGLFYLPDILYSLTFSRYPHMAYLAWQDQQWNDLFLNLAVFVAFALALPTLSLMILLKKRSSLSEL